MKLPPPPSLAFASFHVWKWSLILLTFMIGYLWINLSIELYLGTRPPGTIENRIYANTIFVIAAWWLLVRRDKFAAWLNYWLWQVTIRP